MKTVAIITLVGCNYGNRLQNYAIQKYLDNNNIKAFTMPNNMHLNIKNYSLKNNFNYLKSIIKSTLMMNGIYRTTNAIFTNSRTKKFINFNRKNINFLKKNFNFNRKYDFDYYLVGSDQVWNPFFGLKDLGLLDFNIDNDKKIAFSASIGVDYIPENLKKKYCDNLHKIKNISVREEQAKRIILSITGRNDIEVLVDPTMLLNAEEWDKVSKKPEQIKEEEKYILNYFLGELSDSRKSEIERIAKENNCKIINIMDKRDPFYVSGPSEFLYLEKNAFLICTDSFHSSVFAILYNRPFIIFDREQEGLQSMNSRIDTLIEKFNLKNRRFSGSITEENLNHDYTEAYKILEKEREKSLNFLKNALDIKE